MNQEPETEIEPKKEDPTRAEFHRQWCAGLSQAADMLSRLPIKSALYEMAWKAFIAGRKSRV